MIPQMLRNIVLHFLKSYHNENNSFSHFFLIEIIKKEKIRNDSKLIDEFLELTINIFLMRKQLQSLKNLIIELENVKPDCSLIYYGKLIIILSEGNKWSSISEINKICADLNETCNLNMVNLL